MELYAIIGTFSIVARDPGSGDFGVAVATAAPAVGALAPHAIAGVAAVSTQSFVNVDLGRKAVRIAELGVRIGDAIESLLKVDPHREYRQIIGVDNHGSYGYTGSKCVPWAGHIVEDDVAVAGNMIAGEAVLEEMLKAYKSSSGDPFPLRLLKALKAGEDAGGDIRGKRSAALLIASRNPRWEHNLRVDDHVDPVNELIRIYNGVIETMEAFRKRYGELMDIIRL
ncbi:MAG: DUF1028 domain-containing protein [Sulfolobales archaeon]